MAHLHSSSYYQDSHDDYASSSSSHRQPYHDRSLHIPKTERRGRPAYTTVRPFVINSTDDHDRPVRRERDDYNEHHRRVGDYVADRLVPTMLRSSDRPVEVFMNFGDTKLALPEDSHRVDRASRASSRGPNAIIYNAPGCSLTIDGRRCDRYCHCHRCDLLECEHHDRDRRYLHHRELDLNHDDRRRNRHPRSRSHIRVVSHSRNPSPSPLPLPLPIRDRHHHRHQELDLDHVGRHRDRHPRSHSHIHIVSHSRNPSPSPLPLPGLFPIATAVEKASHSARGARSHGNGISHALCPGCLIKTTVYKDGYCADCDPPRYSTSSSRRADVLPISSGTRVQYVRETDGSASDDSWARVEVASRADRDRRRTGRGRSTERVKVYDVLTDSRGYGESRRRGGSRWEKERRLTPRYSGYASESDL